MTFNHLISISVITLITLIGLQQSAFAARPIKNLPKGSVEIFNECVDSFCKRTFIEETGVRVVICDERNLSSCCLDAAIACNSMCFEAGPEGIDNCEKACGTGQRTCDGGDWVSAAISKPEDEKRHD